jgi:hypothetical protein
MHPLEQLYAPTADIVAMVDEETDVRSTNAHTAKWTIMQPKRVERECALKTTQKPAIQTQSMNVHATPAVTQDTSKRTAFTSNVPGINATESIKSQHPHRLQHQAIVT